MFEAVIDVDKSNGWFDVYLVGEVRPTGKTVGGRLEEVTDVSLEKSRGEGKLSSLAAGGVLLGSSRDVLAGTLKSLGYLGVHFLRADLLAAWISPLVQDDARGVAVMLRSGKKCVAFPKAMNGLRELGFRYVESCERVRMRRRYKDYERKTHVLWHDGKLCGVRCRGSDRWSSPRYYELGSKLTKAVEERVRQDNTIRDLEGLRPEYGLEAFVGHKMRVSNEFVQFYQSPTTAVFAYGDEQAVKKFKDARMESIREAAAAIGVPPVMLNIRLNGNPNNEYSRFDPEVALGVRRRWPVPYRLMYGSDVEFGLRPGKLQTRRLLSDAGYCRYMAMKGKPDLLIDYRAWRKLRNKRLLEREEYSHA